MRPVVVVLGASGGIGRAVTASQVAHGRHVVAVARGEKILGMKDDYVTPVIGDAANPEDLDNVFAIAADIGAVDAVVHSVFADARVPLTELATADLQQVFATGVTSALRTAQLLYKQARLRPRPAKRGTRERRRARRASPRLSPYAAVYPGRRRPHHQLPAQRQGRVHQRSGHPG
jgi:NAD(P)-dependent dehydrogenase (short-subunit alcohol dehydrogenase family)